MDFQNNFSVGAARSFALAMGFMTTVAVGQVRIQGTMKNAETGQPVHQGNVVVKDTNYGDAADSSGFYTIEGAPGGAHTLVFTAIGYKTIEKDVQLGTETLTLSVEFWPVVLEARMIYIVRERTAIVGRPGNIPGAAHIISRKGLDVHSYADIHRVLREIPGMNIQEEDGFGSRPNIGMRGTGSERSQKITLMEDGVLIAPAPYSAPSAYYFPTVGRMEGVEVRKGSSQIQYGPNTNGGALNMISTTIPSKFTLRGNILAGAYGTFRAHAYAGNSHEHFGWLLETHQYNSDGFKILDNGGNTGFDKMDYLGKFRLNTSENATTYQALEIKLSVTDEVSHETYLGLSENDFSIKPFRRYRASQNDRLNADHSQVQLRHFIKPTQWLDITTTAYRNDFYRNWYKLDKVGGEKIATILTDPSENAAAFDLLTARDSDIDQYQIKANKRTYFGQGIQSILNWRSTVAGINNEFEISVRYHEDEEDRFQHVDKYQMVGGKLKRTTQAAPGSKDNRIGSAQAISWYIRDKITYNRVTIVPGVRTEDILLTRTEYSTADPERKAQPEIYKTAIYAIIPGIGITYKYTSALTMIAGFHKGFTPPGPGKEGNNVKAEESLNTELGLRIDKAGFLLDGLVFMNRYDNMLGADLLATGGEGTGDQFNAGEVDVFGVELSGNYSARMGGYALPLRASYTYTDAEFRNSFTSDFGAWGTVVAGDKLPYIAEHQLFVEGTLKGKKWNLTLSSKYTSAMRTQAGQGAMVASETVDAALILDISGEFRVLEDARLYFNVRNVTDQVYIVAQRPAGVRPGLPRTFAAGVKFDF